MTTSVDSSVLLDLPDALLAGSIYRDYLENKGSAKRVLPDFLIGA